MPRRSMLFSPGDRPDMMQKAAATNADSVIFDLEDAVAPGAKADARETVRNVIADVETAAEICVRINPVRGRGEGDVEAVATVDGVDTLVVPMVDGAEEVGVAATALDAVGATDVDLVPLIETPQAVLAVDDIASAPRVTGAIFGAEDFRAAIGASPLPDGRELLHARERVVTVAAAAGIDAIDTVYTDIGDSEGLREAAIEARKLGFDGKAAIHPEQVETLNDAFTPDSHAVEWAERVLEAKREADERGEGVFVVDGEMVDEPIVERARTVLRRTTDGPDVE